MQKTFRLCEMQEALSSANYKAQTPLPLYQKIAPRWIFKMAKKCNTPQKRYEICVLFLLLPLTTWCGLLNPSCTEKPALMPFEMVDERSVTAH